VCSSDLVHGEFEYMHFQIVTIEVLKKFDQHNFVPHNTHQ
jgi:hypothetical protein